jgi:hypothetical protein
MFLLGFTASDWKLVSIEDLRACDPLGQGAQTDAAAALKRKLEKLNFTHVKALFASRKLAFSTGMIMGVWGLIGKYHPSAHSTPLNMNRSGISSIQCFPPIHPSHPGSGLW